MTKVSGAHGERALRFVLPVSEGNSICWRIAVRAGDLAHAQALVRDYASVTDRNVIAWFSKHAKRWPIPEPSGALHDFVRALSALQVTRSKPVKDLQSMTPERRAVAGRIAQVRDAIKTLASELPDMVATASSKSHIPFDAGQLAKLEGLALAAVAAEGIIVAPSPPPKEAVWHESAKLIEWYLRRIIRVAGRAEEVGISENSPLVRLVCEALDLVETKVTTAAIAKVLQRENGEGLPAQSLAWIKQKGYAILA